MVTSSAQPPPGFRPKNCWVGGRLSKNSETASFSAPLTLPQNPRGAHGNRLPSIIFAEKRDLFREAAYKRYTVPVGHRLE